MNNVTLSTRLLVTLVFMGMLLAASIIPGRAQPGDSVFVWLVEITPMPLQKILHVLLYGVLTVLWVWTLAALDSKLQRLAAAFAIAVCFGATMEWYQTRVPGRFGTILDAGLNAAGALLGLAAAALLL